MNLLKKLFGKNEKKEQIKPEEKTPDNTRLQFLLNNYAQHNNQENYLNVYNELYNGNSYLMIPSLNNEQAGVSWHVIEAGKTLQLLTFNIDDIKVLGAFTSLAALSKWAKKPMEYTSIRARDVLTLCEQNDIGRLVINSDQPDMFVMERSRKSGHIETIKIEKETEVLIGYPAKPLSNTIIKKLIEEFEKVDTIAEAYQYLMEMNGTQSIVIGLKFSLITENSRKLANYAVGEALKNEELPSFVDVVIMNELSMYDTVRNIPGSLIYKAN